MISFGTVFAAILPVYLLVLTGAVLRLTGVLRPEHEAGVMRLVYIVMLPCFMLDKILGAEVLRSGSTVFWAMFLGCGLILAGMVIARATAGLLGMSRGTGLRTFTLSAGCQNYGFTAVPVLEILWGGNALAMVFVHNLGVEIIIWSLGAMILSGSGGLDWRKLINGPIIAVSAGLLLVLFRLDGWVCGPVRQTISALGIGAFPVAIAITGATMVGLARGERPTAAVIFGSLLVRLCLVPAVILTAAKFLPMDIALRQVLVVQAAMPAAMTPIMLARLYGGRPAIASQVVLATTVGSMVTLPWIVFLGIRWTGLQTLLP